jgi:thiosulfate/3-mercaptopyruvate sulfurtransferase
MAYTTTISVEELADHLVDPDWVIVDCRFRLTEPDQGRKDYQQLHIRGAMYAHLDQDLSGQVIKGVTGRHPLPSVEKISKVYSKLGVDYNTQVVAYDDLGGALAAVRVWWLLRWLGHDAVAVLDGGWQHWIKKGLPVRSGIETRKPGNFEPHLRNNMLVTAEDVEVMRQNPGYLVLDARAADRFRGENETIDPIAGHIPGAISAPYAENLNPDGTFRAIKSLRTRYQRILGDVPIDHVACYCGSGVTSVHDILVLMMAGLGEARLYAGSYSEWITDPDRPVEK